MSVRIYELARELGLPNKDLVAKVRGLGIDVKNHMSVIDLDDAQRLKRAMEKERMENRDVQRLSSTVIRRRSRVPAPAAKTAPSSPSAASEAAPAVAPAELLPDDVADAWDEPPPIDAAPAEAPEPGQPADLGAPPAAAEVPVAEAPSPDPVGADTGAPEDFAAQYEAPAEPAPPAAELSPEPTAVAPEPSMEASVPSTPETYADTTTSAPPAVMEQPIGDSAGGDADDQPTVAMPLRPKYQIRYAPGFEPGGKYSKAPPGRYGQVTGGAARSGPAGSTAVAGEEPALTAADAARMMAPAKPRVVITDLDARRGGLRREITRAELFKDKRFRQQQQQRARRKKPATKQRGKKTEITTPAEHKRVIRVEDAIGVGEIARQMGVKASEVLKKLWAMGLTNIMINQSIDADTASLLASEFGYEVADVAFHEEDVLQEAEDRAEDLEARAPVITVMGHVDHGKTSVLDAIRHSDVVSGEAGGITQHIGAYRVSTEQGEFVFLDTPGHEAFTQMRLRGAQCTDIVVLVVAADDGPMPQTLEALDHARDAEVPIIVAVNKCDLPNANPDRVRSALAERNLVPDDWGGDTQFVDVSARTKQGLDKLLEALALQAELLELKANPGKPARGSVLEARLDRARGCMCTVLIQEGTLHVGDTIVAGAHLGKVRAMLDHRGKQVKEAPPSTPVELLGLSGVPNAGDPLNAVTDEKAARQVSEHRQTQARQRELAGASATKTYEEILGQIKSGDVHELKLLLKADVHGSSEAVKDALLKMSTHKVTVNVISAGVGGIHEADVNLAKASGAVVLGFNVRTAGKAAQLAERETVEIRIYDVIYELLDDVKVMMQGLLPKERRERFAGRAEVRETFTIPKVGVVAGCSVTDGRLFRGAHLRLVRDSVKLFDSRISSLRRFKEDVKEVEKGYECGVSVEGNNDIQVGDVIEVYEVEEVAASLT